MTTLYLLRHGKTKVDPDTPVSEWALSDEGVRQAQELAEKNTFRGIDVIIASGEHKAYQTAKPIADALGKEILRAPEISELDRDKGGFLDHEAYENTAEQCLRNRDKSFHNWETANHALERFSKKIREIEKQFDGMNVLVVGHGYTINMYFANLLGQLDHVFDRLKSNDFCDWGIVRDGKVIKDIGGERFERVGEKMK